MVDAAELQRRRDAMNAKGDEGWKPVRKRVVTQALQAYGLLASSASKGAVRDITQITGRKLAAE